MERIVLIDSTKPALRLAMKVALMKLKSTHSGVNTMKAAVKMASPLMKLKAGDQKPRPAIKIAAVIKLVSPHKVKPELINSCGLSA